MPFVLVRHQVKDYDAWKAGFDADDANRTAAGFVGASVCRNADDPNEVVALLEVDSLDKARAFTGSEKLREVMEEFGVVGKPDIVFLNAG